MKLLTVIFLAPLLAPAICDAWTMDRSPFFNYGPMRSNISPMRILREQQALANRVAKEWNCGPNGSGLVSAPRYDIKEEEDKFAVAVDLPGISPRDITVSYEDDSNLLSIIGRREFSNERGSYSEKFSQSFYLDPSVDIEKISANLENGVLIVSAPKDFKKLESNVRTIPIVTPSSSTGDNVAVHKGSETATSTPEDDLRTKNRQDESIMKPVHESEQLDQGDTLDLDSGEDF